MDDFELNQGETSETPAANAAGENEMPAHESFHKEQKQMQDALPFADSPFVMNHNTAETDNSAHPHHGSEPVKAKKPKGNVGRRILAAVLTIALVAGSCGITAFCVNQRWERETAEIVKSMDDKLGALEKTIQTQEEDVYPAATVNKTGGLTIGQVYSQNVSSVVAISNQGITTNVYGQVSETASSGSGFIVTEDGYVVTNYHVVKDANKLTVITSDSREYDANLVGYDSNNDLAVLKIEAEGLQPVKLGSSDLLAVGDQVVAIGNPLGELTSTLTAGYISAKDRGVSTGGAAINMLQTDAAINSGNSGGPLFNMQGEVVGITTAKYSGATSSGAYIEGIGFAIPIDDVVGMINDLTQLGYITGAYLGVMVSDMDSDTANRYGLPMGAYVQEVTSGNCAEAAGVLSKDIITGLGSYEVKSVSDLTRALRHFKGGEVTTITVYRGGSEVELTVTLDEKPRDTGSSQATLPQNEMPSEGDYGEWYEFFAPFFGDNG